MQNELNCRKCGLCNKKGKPSVTQLSKACNVRRGIMSRGIGVFEKLFGRRNF